MKNYISVDMAKAVNAVSVGGRIYEDVENSEIPNGKEIEYGYKIHFDTGEECFCDAAEFEKYFLPLDVNENLKTDKPSISEKMVDNFIARFYSTTVGDKTTVVRAVLVNGFEIVESSSCVSPENYDEEIGVSICIDKIKDKVWELLGFLLATAVNGFNYETRYPSILHEEMKGSLDGEEEALPFSDLPEGEECEEGWGDPEPCEEDCGGDDYGSPLPQTPYGSEGACVPNLHITRCAENWPNCPVEKECESCVPFESCSCHKDAKPQQEFCPDSEDGKKEESKPVSIIIEEKESGAFEIHMEGDSDKATVALEMAMSSLFVSECADMDREMQLILADNMAARIGRGVRSMIMSGAKTEKE